MRVVGKYMDTIIFVETTKSGSSREAIKSAERLGYFTVLITENKNFLLQRDEFPDVHHMLHLIKVSEKAIREEITKLEYSGKVIKAIISFVDPFVSTAAKLSNEICRSAITWSALKKMEDKTATREALKQNRTAPKYETYNPSDHLYTFINEFNNKFPIIIKSPVSKASKDVYLVDNKREMEKKMQKLLKLYPSQKILLEEYILGPQYLAEVVVYRGELNIVSIIKQEITKKAKFIITGYEVQIHFDEQLFKTLYDAISSIITDLKIVNATCHLEMRLVNGSWKLIEINPRISGGAMNRMIEEAFGINLVEETIKLYLGIKPNLIRKYENYIYTHYITINSFGNLLKITGRNKAEKEIGVREVYIKPRKGAMLTPPTSMGHRYGYVIATGATSVEAKSNAINAAKNIKFYLDPM